MVQEEKANEDNVGENGTPGEKSRAFKMIEERLEKRRRRASVGRLVFYVILLILVIILMLWFRSRSGGM
jgi:predicted nucleic acid-binding Zn ribbon protein